MMEMDYNNFFASAASQPFQYMPYSAGGAFVNNDGTAHPTTIENPLDAHMFSADFDYHHFDSTATQNPALAGISHPSDSPQTQSLAVAHPNNIDAAFSLEDEGGVLSLQRRRSSSEEKESLTPAQTRRKAQNRAAQRAFRERKERHVRELEAKLNLLTTTTSSLQSDNERLKLMLQRAQTENEILRATASSTSPPSHYTPGFVDDPALLPVVTAAARSRAAAAAAAGGNRDASFNFNTQTSTRSPAPPSSSSPGRLGGTPESDTHLLSPSATWDLLQSHPLYLSGAVDIGEVCERLKKMARCDTMGPMFDEDGVRRVIEEVGRSGGDQLI